MTGQVINVKFSTKEEREQKKILDSYASKQLQNFDFYDHFGSAHYHEQAIANEKPNG